MFKRIVGKTFGYEGGYNPGDTGGETMYGISKKAHPGLNIKGVTKGAAEDIYKKEYYDAIGASQLPPALRMAAFDTAVIAGPGRAREFLSKSGGDPLKFLDLRDRFMHGLVASNPAKYGKYEKGWNNRNADLRKTVVGMMGERTEPERAVAYDPQARPLAFKPKEAAQPIAMRPAEVAPSKPAETAARQVAPAGSVLNRINPKDPSGPLLPESHPIAAAPAPTPAVAPQPSRAAEAAPKRHFSLGDLNPIGTAHAGDRGVYPTGPAADDEVRVPKIDKGPAATEPRHPTWNSAPEGTYGPGISEQPSFMTDFGQLPNRDMLGETPYAQTMAGAPLSSFGDVQPLAPASEAAPAPEPIASRERAAPATGQKYWGDWRDAEPFKSDPIGQFFDSLSGETPHAAAPGHIEPQSGFDLGQMSGGLELPNIELPFKAGGVVRAHKADGGYLDPFNALGEGLGAIGEGIGSAVSSIGEGLGGLFAPEQPQAEPQASGVAQPSAYERWAENPFSQFLWNAGQAMMARPNASPLEALGEGLPYGMRGAMAAGEQAHEREALAAKKREEEQRLADFQQQLAGETEPSATGETVSQPDVETVREGLPAAPVRTAAAERPETREQRLETPGQRPATRVLDPETMDIEADPTIRRLFSEITRISSIPTTKDLLPVKNASISNLKFQIEERRRQLESSARARKAQVEAEQKTPESRARAKQLEIEQEELAKESVGIEQAARQADQRIATLSRMKDAVESGKFRTGFGAETEIATKKAIQAIFPNLVDEEAIAMAEQFDKDALQAVTDATGGKLGAGVSDSDVRFLTRQQAGLGTTKAGNVRTLDAAIKIERRKKDIAEFTRKYKEEHGGYLDARFNGELAKWAEEHPMFPKEKAASAKGKSSETVDVTTKTLPSGVTRESIVEELKRRGAM